MLATRLRTLPAAVAPVLVGTAMAIADGKFALWPAAAAMAVALLLQIGVNLANDYFDYIKGIDTQDRLGPPRVTQSGLIPAKQVSDELTAAIDLLPTLCSACGIDLGQQTTSSPKIDGQNVWSHWIGRSREPHPRSDLLFWNGWAVPQAIRVGDWKLYFDKVKEIDDSNQGPALFNLVEDPAEQTNLSAEHPERVKEMKALAAQRLADIEETAIPLGGRPSGRPQQNKRGAWLK